MMSSFIYRVRRLRAEAMLAHPCTHQYAFVGMGSHSMANLYPVLNLLHVPLKYICIRSSHKAKLISSNPAFKHIVVTTSLDTVLSDPVLSAVFVSATPSTHYHIASSVLRQGKALFVEKPPCQTLSQLESLIALQESIGSYVQVGLQKRYAPAIRKLKSCLKGGTVCNYSLRYCVGHYPEGDAITELFIHPLDLVLHLFGSADVMVLRQASSHTLVMMLSHGNVVGTVSLFTGYSWATPVEELIVHTRAGVYTLSGIDTLTFQPVDGSFVGIPVEKICHSNVSVEYLCRHDSFSPTLQASTWVEHGFYHELKDFVDHVEGNISSRVLKDRPSLQSLRPTYQLINTCLRQL